jgi:hypothetical protein
MIAEKSKPP